MRAGVRRPGELAEAIATAFVLRLQRAVVMQFARRVFLLAGIYGLFVLLPQYFLEDRTGRDYPPPITHPDFYGIDTPTRDQLIAAQKSIPEICEYIGADSLGFLTLEDLHHAMGDQGGQGFCYACFDGKYPVPPETAKA